MKEFARTLEEMQRADNKATFYRQAARDLKKTADKSTEIATERYDFLVSLRNGMLKEALAERDLVICGSESHRIMDEVEPGDVQPTEAELGIVPSSEARLFYRRGMTVSGGKLLGFWTSLAYYCGEHISENKSWPSFAKDSDEKGLVTSEVQLGPDGQLTRVLDGVGITKEVEGMDLAIDVLNKRNQVSSHKDMTIEIYRNFGIPDLPHRPF